MKFAKADNPKLSLFKQKVSVRPSTSTRPVPVQNQYQYNTSTSAHQYSTRPVPVRMFSTIEYWYCSTRIGAQLWCTGRSLKILLFLRLIDTQVWLTIQCWQNVSETSKNCIVEHQIPLNWQILSFVTLLFSTFYSLFKGLSMLVMVFWTLNLFDRFNSKKFLY